MKTIFTALFLLIACGVTAQDAESSDPNTLVISVGGRPLASFQSKPLAHPPAGDLFKGSDFIHPLKTPSGFVVTDLQPADHPHHFGLWWPWKYVEIDDRKILCWELQEGAGIVEAVDAATAEEGITAHSVYIDRKAPGGPQTLINETLNVKVSPIRQSPVPGYWLDIEIVHESAMNKAITIPSYRYSGFTFRGAASWNHETSTILTSKGYDRETSNFTRAAWVRVEGEANDGRTAGVLLMGHPKNRSHPEYLRTWNKEMDNGAVFINFNPVQQEPWHMEPGRKYIRNYRVFVYDGSLSTADGESLWKQYAHPDKEDLSDRKADAPAISGSE